MKDGESRTATVPLRRGFQRVPTWRKAKRAVDELRKYVLKHAKVEEVKIGKWVNEYIWDKGSKNPPSKVIVKITKNKNVANVELATLPARAKRFAESAEAKESTKKKREAARKAKEETKKKTEDHKKKKEEEKKQLEDVKKAKMTREQEIAMHNVKKATMTKAQEIAMHK